jgi:hypothetical protein
MTLSPQRLDKAAERRAFVPPSEWPHEKLGIAAHMIFILATTPPGEWRTKQEIYNGLSDFRIPAELTERDAG